MLNTDEAIALLETQVAVLGKDVSNTQDVLNKIDSAVAKLADISNDLTKLLTLQTQKIDQHDEIIKSISSALDRRREEIDLKITKIEDRVYSIDKEFQHMKDNMKVFSTSCQNVEKKVEEFEKFKWMTLGAGTILGFLISYIIPNIPKIIALL